MRTPIDFRKAWVRASVLLISREKISLPAMLVKGVSDPKACAIPKSKSELTAPCTEIIQSLIYMICFTVFRNLSLFLLLVPRLN